MQVQRVNTKTNKLLQVVNAARVSYNTQSDELTDKDRKLIKFLADHKHKSPFFHPQICFYLNRFDLNRFSKEEIAGLEWYSFMSNNECVYAIRCSLWLYYKRFYNQCTHYHYGYEEFEPDYEWLQKHDKHLLNASRIPYLTFNIKAPIFVVRQLEKHQIGFTKNERSGRYTKFENEFYTPTNWRKQSESNKQGSNRKEYVENGCIVEYNNILSNTQLWYDKNIENGMAGEQARMVLPLSTITNFVWTGGLQDLARLFTLRLKDDVQYETRLLVAMIYKEVKKEYKNIDKIIELYKKQDNEFNINELINKTL